MYKQFQLQNGITVGLFKLDGVLSVAMKALVTAGPVVEDESITGASHFIEHCVLDGTKSYKTKKEFATKLEELGISYGGYTSISEMGFEFDVPYTNLFEALNILDEILFAPTFEDEAIEKERKVILEEMIDRDNSNELMFYYNCADVRLKSANHPLKMKVIGSSDVISNIKKEQLLELYRKIFVPNNMYFCLVGNFDIEKTQDYITKIFGSKKNNGEFERRKFSNEDLSDYSTLAKKDDKFTNAYSSISFPSYPIEVDNKTKLTLQVMGAMLANMRTSRLFQDVREKEGLVYNINSSSENSWGIGNYSISFEADVSNVKRIMQIVFEDLQSIKKNGFSSEELEHTKNYFSNRTLLSFSNPWSINQWIISYLFDKEKVLMPNEVNEIGKTISLSDIFDVVKYIFNMEKMNIVTMGKINENEVDKIQKSLKL